LARVPWVRVLEEPAPRQGFVEEADFRGIVAHLQPGHALAATIAFETAWRIAAEVFTLEWSRVDLDEGCIHLDREHSKSGEPRTAYLSPTTTKRLVAWRGEVDP
jgi:integrase